MSRQHRLLPANLTPPKRLLAAAAHTEQAPESKSAGAADGSLPVSRCSPGLSLPAEAACSACSFVAQDARHMRLPPACFYAVLHDHPVLRIESCMVMMRCWGS